MQNGLPPSYAVRRGIGFVLPAACVEFDAQAILPGKSAMYLAFSAIAARSDIAPARWRKPFLIWMDGVEAGWAIPLLLIGFIAVWLALRDLFGHAAETSLEARYRQIKKCAQFDRHEPIWRIDEIDGSRRRLKVLKYRYEPTRSN